MVERSIIKDNFIKYVDGIVSENKISHAYLIEVDNYGDDLTYIFDFIKMILCNCKYDKLNSVTNNIVYLVDNDSYPDLYVIEPDGSFIKKSQLMELQKEYNNKSLIGQKRIYVIKNAEKFNASSANTMLKFLEEPEDDIIAILITYNRYHVIDTILSRCQVLTLKEDTFAIGEDSNDVLDLLECVLNPKNFFIRYNFYVSDLINDKDLFKSRLRKVERLMMEYLNCKFSSADIEFVDNDFFNILNRCSDRNIVNYIAIIEDNIVKLDFNVNFKLWLDSLFSKLIGGSFND